MWLGAVCGNLYSIFVESGEKAGMLLHEVSCLHRSWFNVNISTGNHLIYTVAVFSFPLIKLSTCLKIDMLFNAWAGCVVSLMFSISLSIHAFEYTYSINHAKESINGRLALYATPAVHDGRSRPYHRINKEQKAHSFDLFDAAATWRNAHALTAAMFLARSSQPE